MYLHRFLIVVRLHYPTFIHKGKDKTEESVKNAASFGFYAFISVIYK